MGDWQKLNWRDESIENLKYDKEIAFLADEAYNKAIDDLIAKCESAKFTDDDETLLSDIHQGVNSGLSMAIHFAKELKSENEDL